MKNIQIVRKFIIVLIFIALPLSIIANKGFYPPYLQALNALNGLPTNEVKRLYQDKEGYIWIATTDGLCSYDGYQLKTFKSNLYSPELLTNNNISCLTEDGNHHIYIGTFDGLNILDKKTGEFKKLYHKEFSNNVINSIVCSRTGKLFIATETGLYRYLPEKDSCFIYNEQNTGLKSRLTGVSHLYEDLNNQIWIGTFQQGLFRYDTKTDKFYEYPSINKINSAHIIFEDSKHHIWVGTFGAGLYMLENPYSQAKVTYNYIHNNKIKTSLCDNYVYAIAEDTQSNTLWVGTRSGLSILPLEKPEAGFVNYLPESERGIPFNEVDALITDRQGTIWIGTLGGGLYHVNTHKPAFGLNQLSDIRSELRSSSVRSLYVNEDGNVWLGIGSHGLVIQDRKNNSCVHYSKIPELNKIGPIPTVNSFTKTTDGKIMLATYNGGVLVLDKKAKPVEWIKNESHKWLLNNNVYCIKQDTRGYLWFGTRNGLSFYAEGAGYAFSPCYIDAVDVSNNLYRCIEEDYTGTLWCGTNNIGVIKVSDIQADPASIDFHKYSLENGKLNCNNVQCAFEDSHKRLWLGTDGGGLSYYDRTKDVFIAVNPILGLPCDGIFSILEDEFGDLWIGTNSGLLRLHVADKIEKCTFRLYTVSSGLQDNIFMRNAAFRTKDGEMFFGGHRGYNNFYPSKIEENDEEALITITDIKIYNDSWISLDKKHRDKISGLSPEYTNKIVLNYKQNNFNIEFSALNYINPMNIKYAYKLDGFDKDWQTTDASHRFAYYNNLDAGTYTFSLKSVGDNGIWSDVRKMKIVILPPFWMTWWAYLIYIIVIALIAWMLIRTAHNRLILKNELHLRELEQNKSDELNHAKLQFFTNITHELLTPLTIISATVDELKMQAPQYTEFYKVMSNNINRLIRLLQQILEFRKAETGNLKLRVSEGDLAAFVKNEAECFRPLIKNKKLNLSVVCRPESIIGYFDTDKMDKILYNLISNAAKYNDEGGSIEITLSYADKKDFVQMTVKDDGRGISSEKQKTLFQRFYEGEYRKFKTIGTGIGLSLTKDLITLHRGDINVESKSGKGTTFFITIPIERSYFKLEEIEDENLPVQNDVAEEKYEKQELAPEEEEKPKSHTLLLVEDNEDLLQIMVRLLGREYNVFTARNGKEGVEIIENQDIDLVVSDIMMQEMDGIEFCKYIKAKLEYCHIPVILLTAKTKEEDRAEAYDSGADGFIIKPFNLIVLHARIRNLLKTKERTAHDFKNQLVFEAKELNYTSLDEDFLKQAIDIVNKHLGDSEFEKSQFVDEMGTSRATLDRKLKSLTDLSTSAFIRNIRLKAACRILEEKKNVRISELAYAVGFNDPKYFSACFKKEFGMHPSEYKERFVAS